MRELALYKNCIIIILLLLLSHQNTIFLGAISMGEGGWTLIVVLHELPNKPLPSHHQEVWRTEAEVVRMAQWRQEGRTRIAA